MDQVMSFVSCGSVDSIASGPKQDTRGLQEALSPLQALDS